MSFLNIQQLPFVGMSYEFHGEKEGAQISAYIVNAKPGQGPPLHTHPYVEVIFMVEGCARSRWAMKRARQKPVASLSFPRTHRIDLLTPARRYCVRSIFTRVLNSFRRISND